MNYIVSHINENTPSVLCEDRTEGIAFMTSLDIIQKVMNVPMCALTSLLRSNGYASIDDTSSSCIDEKMLEIFALAYERKIRSYFLSSLRNINELSQNELRSFHNFIELFKNENVEGKPSKWSEIDTDHLRRAFIDKVKRNTPSKSKEESKKSFQNIFDGLEVKRRPITYISIEATIQLVASIRTAYEQFCDIISHNEDVVLEEVVHSYCYVAKSIYIKQEWHECSLLRNIYKSARYHIFSSDTDEEDVKNQIYLNFKRVIFKSVFHEKGNNYKKN